MNIQEFQEKAEQMLHMCLNSARETGYLMNFNVVRRTDREITFQVLNIGSIPPTVETYCIWLDQNNNPRFNPINS